MSRGSIVAACLLTALMAPGVAAEHGPADGTLSGTATVVAAWWWSHLGNGSAIGASDAGLLQIDWSETYRAGQRVSASAHIMFQGALGKADCTVSIDDVNGSSSTAGTVWFLVRGGELPCRSASASESAPDQHGMCSASTRVVAFRGEAPPPLTEGSGSGSGPCQEEVDPSG